MHRRQNPRDRHHFPAVSHQAINFRYCSFWFHAHHQHNYDTKKMSQQCRRLLKAVPFSSPEPLTSNHDQKSHHARPASPINRTHESTPVHPLNLRLLLIKEIVDELHSRCLRRLNDIKTKSSECNIVVEVYPPVDRAYVAERLRVEDAPGPRE